MEFQEHLDPRVHRDSQAQRVIKESQELLLRVQQAKEEKREHQAVWAEMVTLEHQVSMDPRACRA